MSKSEAEAATKALNNAISIQIGCRDVMEQSLFDASPDLLKLLLKDYSYFLKKDNKYSNIRWLTSSYEARGVGFKANNLIAIKSITGANKDVIRPRIVKSQEEQKKRSSDSAEVFTPIWVCNLQNNLIDKAWFGTEESPFNKELEKGYIEKNKPIKFPNGKTWQDYVLLQRLEITCGEAPYLVSRYDVVTGEIIPIGKRVGLLDRKLRVICENVVEKEQWLEWATKALESTYGFDIQGDNVLLARENILYSVLEWYAYKFPTSTPNIVDDIPLSTLKCFAQIISWNIWQMDGIKYTVPEKTQQIEIGTGDLFNPTRIEVTPIYSQIKDWSTGEKLYFKDLMKEGR